MSNEAIEYVKAQGDTLMIFLEDDWELRQSLDIRLTVSLLQKTPTVGLVRWGYMSVGLKASLLSAVDQLWWTVEPNGYTYRYTGHPSLRHLRFHEQYGMFSVGYSPGKNELDMCAKVNKKPNGPSIVIPTDIGTLGFFAHIGAESLADKEPD